MSHNLSVPFCSGCVTSAESVLVGLQSHEEVYRVLAERPTVTAFMSISPQSLASLAALHGIQPAACLARLRAFFQSKHNFAAVTDTTFARHLSLRETRREYRRTKALNEKAPPVLASACPGWVCYAEKTQPQLLPFMSKTKSPQAIQGMLVKDYWSRQRGRHLARDQIYHVAVMPCFDKKLEASRPDFETDGVRDVDCVISTGEVQRMLEDAQWDLGSQAATTDTDEPPLWPELLQHPGTTSGSFMHNVVAELVNTASPAQLTTLRLDSKNIRGGDHSEHVLYAGSEPIFRGAICNGFRNLQNVVRKISPGGTGGTKRAVVRKRRDVGQNGGANTTPDRPYDYIEIMACPSGCINGGGQMPAPKAIDLRDEEGIPIVNSPTTLPAKEWVSKVEAIYWSTPGQLPSAPVETVDPTILPFLEPLQSSDFEQLCRSVEDKLANGFQTQFRAVEAPEEVNGLAVKW